MDINHDKIAVTEAQKTKIKVIGLLDTNSDPEDIDYVIPSNDDSIKAISLMCDAVAAAVNEGKLEMPVAAVPMADTSALPKK